MEKKDKKALAEIIIVLALLVGSIIFLYIAKLIK